MSPDHVTCLQSANAVELDEMGTAAALAVVHGACRTLLRVDGCTAVPTREDPIPRAVLCSRMRGRFEVAAAYGYWRTRCYQTHAHAWYQGRRDNRRAGRRVHTFCDASDVCPVCETMSMIGLMCRCGSSQGQGPG